MYFIIEYKKKVDVKATNKKLTVLWRSTDS